MAEYIEREALLKDIGETVLFSVRGDAELPTPEMRGANKVKDRIKAAPAADVVEVRHGVWKDTVTGYVCSVCRSHEMTKRFLYCPNCGAKMDGKGDGE